MTDTTDLAEAPAPAASGPAPKTKASAKSAPAGVAEPKTTEISPGDPGLPPTIRPGSVTELPNGTSIWSF